MAGKSDESLPNLHCLIAGGSGSGKTTYAKRWYKTSARVVLFDPDESHAAPGVVYTYDIKTFIKKLVVSSRAKKSRLAFAPTSAGPEELQQFFHALWHVADCDYPMTVVVEELQEMTSSGQARGWHRTAVTRLRKYGVQLGFITQRPQAIDTTTKGMTPHKVTGQLERAGDIEAMAREMDAAAAEISLLLEKNGPEPRKALHYIERLAGKRAEMISIALPTRRKRPAKVAK